MKRSSSLASRRNEEEAFTLIELLVVVGIIALLISILMPSLSAARRTAQNVVCMNNMKQFGFSIQMYQQTYKGFLPGEGMADGDTASKPLGPWDDKSLWANVLPSMIYKSTETYCKMQKTHLSGGKKLPGAKDSSLFVCPTATAATYGQTPAEVSNGYFMMWGLQEGATSLAAPREQRPTYWCYSYNSGLDNLVNGGTVDFLGTRHFKIDILRRPSQVPILIEIMMNPTECQPRFNARLNRAKTKGNAWDSCRITARHRAGANLVCADGRVSWISRQQATTDTAGDSSYRQTGGIIWQPQ